MVDKKKRKPQQPAVPDRVRLVEKEDFGENTFAGALEAVKGVLEKASTPEQPAQPQIKPRKKP